MKRRRIYLAIFLVTLVAALVVPMDASSFRPWLELAHPEVHWIDAAPLARRLPDEDVMLIDVRSVEEYEVSHLPGALRVGATLLQGQQIVVYCSLGVRSAAYAERLQREGYHVRNLDGGIFAWANAGRPVENEGGATRDVHPYNRFFGLFLDVRD